jgi:hypothetical protein
MRRDEAPATRSISVLSFEAWATLRPTVLAPSLLPTESKNAKPTLFYSLIPRQFQTLMSVSFDSTCTSVAWSKCGQGPLEGVLLVAGYSDGSGRVFRLLSTHKADADNQKSRSAFAVPDNTRFMHVAHFFNCSRHEPIAFVAARPTTDGSVAVMLLGKMGGRSLHSTSMHYINDLQPWFDRQLPQDFFFVSAMLWPQMSKTMFVSDCDTFSVDEIDALTGDPPALRLVCCFKPIFIRLQGTPAILFLPCRIRSGRLTLHIHKRTFSEPIKVVSRCLWRAVMVEFTSHLSRYYLPPPCLRCFIFPEF